MRNPSNRTVLIVSTRKVAANDPTNKYIAAITAKAMGIPVDNLVHQSPKVNINGLFEGGSMVWICSTIFSASLWYWFSKKSSKSELLSDLSSYTICSI